MRRADWVGRMWDTVESYRGVPFEWGQHDCCLFAARVLDSIFDSAYTAKIQSEYSDTSSGLAFIERCGGLEMAVCRYLGPPQKMALTCRGHACLISTAAGDGLGVCVGHQVAVASPDVGVAFYSFSVITKSWPDPI